ncbi:MAG: hypothetical protein ACNI3A_00870 [Desulfovibrio sp.]|uniref:hypothetical protein n=1 Tax=Desulfovibrio sp. 7SRBS1 TaxID=3378064 RepID=UPI003B3F8E91
MADGFNDFSQALYDEVMGEMAGTFFGTRTRMEELTQALQSMAEHLAPLAAGVVYRGQTLHWLLPDVGPFYKLLGMETENEARLASLFTPGETMRPALPCGLPMAFTEAGRYAKTVFLAYEFLFKDADAYMHGVYSQHPDKPGRKLLSLHFLQVRDFCSKLNARIREVNTFQTPSGALQSMRTLQPEELDKQRLSGATLADYSQHLDEEMALPEVDFAQLNLPEFPDLPKPDDIKSALVNMAREQHSAHKDVVQEKMEHICHA